VSAWSQAEVTARQSALPRWLIKAKALAAVSRTFGASQKIARLGSGKEDLDRDFRQRFGFAP